MVKKSYCLNYTWHSSLREGHKPAETINKKIIFAFVQTYLFYLHSPELGKLTFLSQRRKILYDQFVTGGLCYPLSCKDTLGQLFHVMHYCFFKLQAVLRVIHLASS